MSSNKQKTKPSEPAKQMAEEPKTFKVVTLSNAKVVGFIKGVQHNFLPLGSYDFLESDREAIIEENKVLFAQKLIKIE